MAIIYVDREMLGGTQFFKCSSRKCTNDKVYNAYSLKHMYDIGWRSERNELTPSGKNTEKIVYCPECIEKIINEVNA